MNIQFGVPVAAALYYCNTVSMRISAGFGNPIVGFILGLQTKKYYYFTSTKNDQDPLWAGYWAPLTFGPMIGGILAGIFFIYQKKVLDNLRDLSKPFFYDDLIGPTFNSFEGDNNIHDLSQQNPLMNNSMPLTNLVPVNTEGNGDLKISPETLPVPTGF